jgi:hypothetical protein
MAEFTPSPSYVLNYGSIKEFNADPAKFLTDLVNKYVSFGSTNWAVPFNHPYYAAPVAIAFGDGDSQAFQDIKNRQPWTLTPRECLENPPAVQVSTVNGVPKSKVDIPGRKHLPVISENGEITWPSGEPPLPPWQAAESGGPGSANIGNSYGSGKAVETSRGASSNAPPSFGKPVPQKPFEHVTCISIGLPIHPETLRVEASYPWGNSPEMKLHSVLGSHVGCAADITSFVVNTLQMFGYVTIAPTFTSWGHEFLMDFQYEGPTSRQSISPCCEREWAVAAGLGTYGLTDMVITKQGMAVILTTIMTSAEISPSPKPQKEYCLFYRDGSCRKCIPRCPGQAIDAEMNPPGRLAAKCDAGGVAAMIYNNTYLKDRMVKELGDYAEMSGNIIWGGSGIRRAILSFPACGRCYTDVPCATSIPDYSELSA